MLKKDLTEAGKIFANAFNAEYKACKSLNLEELYARADDLSLEMLKNKALESAIRAVIRSLESNGQR